MKINTFFEYTLFVDESTFTNHGQINIHDIHYNCRKSSSITNKWIIKQNLMWKKVEKKIKSFFIEDVWSNNNFFEEFIIETINWCIKYLYNVLYIFL